MARKRKTKGDATRSRFIFDGELLHGVETYSVSSPGDRVRWLLGFLRAEVDELTPGELLDLRAGASRFILMADFDEQLHGGPLWPKDSDDPDPAPKLKRLQSKLLAGIERLNSRLPWEPFEGNPPEWILVPYPDGNLVRRDLGTPETTFLLNATDSLLQFWPQLRRCRYEECGALFLPEHGRQHYHQPACSTRARQQRHAPKRKRDFAEEYVQRVEKHKGPGPAKKLRKRQRANKAKRVKR